MTFLIYCIMLPIYSLYHEFISTIYGIYREMLLNFGYTGLVEDHHLCLSYFL